MGVELMVVIDGKEHPAWALHAGDDIIATEYDHDRQRMTVWLAATGRVPPSDEVLSTTP